MTAPTTSVPAAGSRARNNQIFQTVLAIGGLIGVMLAARFYQLLDANYFYAAALILFFLPFGILAFLNRGRRKSRRRVQAAPAWVFIGPPLVAALILINGVFDHQPPEQKVVTIIRKYVSHGRSGPHYRIEFASWRRPGTEKIEVRRDTYDTIHTGDGVAMNVHRGALGFTWIGGVRVVPANSGAW